VNLGSVLPPELRGTYQDPALIRRMLRETRTVAIVGLSPDRQRASWFVGNYLQRAGYRVIPVNPRAEKILGERCFPSLAALPEPPDLVDVFRRPEDLEAVAREAVAVRARFLWFQLRLVNVAAAEAARAAGLGVVMDRCVKIEHGRYAGRLHDAGMNTGVITARRGGV
jgi:predicted CoA-binding protein